MKGYKEYDFIVAKKGDYTGKIYKDNMFGMEFANFSLYDKEGRELTHSTLDETKTYTKKDCEEMIEASIKFMKIVKDEYC